MKKPDHCIPLQPSAPCGSLTGDRASAARLPNNQPSEKRFIGKEPQKALGVLKSHRSVQSNKRFLWYNERIIHTGGAVCDQLFQIVATPGEA